MRADGAALRDRARITSQPDSWRTHLCGLRRDSVENPPRPRGRKNARVLGPPHSFAGLAGKDTRGAASRDPFILRCAPLRMRSHLDTALTHMPGVGTSADAGRTSGCATSCHYMIRKCEVALAWSLWMLV